mmetsp:Transcript_9919/g.15983  ORF Transcript_9919/g.15983 Transcript_9919/m.15983 type:complete len:550 (+) Transcript_9919:80-1729(+)
MEGTPVPGSRSFNPPHSRYGSFDSATHASSEIVDVSLEDDWTAFMDTKQPAEKEKSAVARIAEEATAMANISIPCAVANVLQFLPVTCQLMLVGHLSGVGGKDLDAVALGRAYWNATGLSIGYGVASALRTLCPQAVGAGKPHLCRAYAQRAVFLATLITIPCSILQLNASSILKLMNQPDDLAELAGEYCVRCIPQLYFMLLFTIMQRLMQALNFNWTNFAVCLTVCVLSPGILYFFIGFLGWGYIGAGWGASVYTFLYLCLSIPAMIYQGQGYLFEFEGPSVFDSERIKEYILLAVPGTLQMCLEWWVLETISLFAGMLPNPSVTIGASYIVYNMEGLAVMMWIGNMVAISIRVGEHIGAGRMRKAKDAAAIGMSTGVVVSMILAAVIFTYRESLVTFYTNNDQTRVVASRLLCVLSVLVVCDSCNNATGGIMNGLGQQRWGALFQLAGYYGLAVPIAVTCVFFYTPKRPILYLWSGVALAMASSCVMQLSFLSKYDWGLSIKDAQERLSTRRHRGEHEDGGMEEDLSFDLDASTIAGGDSDATISL